MIDRTKKEIIVRMLFDINTDGMIDNLNYLTYKL